VVVEGGEAALDAAEGVVDRGPVAGALGAVSIIEGPGGHAGADDEPGRGLEQPVPPGRTVGASLAPVAQDGRG